jgi:hypothetical protein
MESLLEELPAKRNGMATEAPSRIVLDLTRLHGTSLRKVCRQTQGWETSTKVKEDGQFAKLVIVQLKSPACWTSLFTHCMFLWHRFRARLGRTENSFCHLLEFIRRFRAFVVFVFH